MGDKKQKQVPPPLHTIISWAKLPSQFFFFLFIEWKGKKTVKCVKFNVNCPAHMEVMMMVVVCSARHAAYGFPAGDNVRPRKHPSISAKIKEAAGRVVGREIYT
jgi:hypothetical protein